jgi:hypothetical protein
LERSINNLTSDLDQTNRQTEKLNENLIKEQEQLEIISDSLKGIFY